jgi:hypothetical protein
LMTVRDRHDRGTGSLDHWRRLALRVQLVIERGLCE